MYQAWFNRTDSASPQGLAVVMNFYNWLYLSKVVKVPSYPLSFYYQVIGTLGASRSEILFNS